MRYNAGTQDSTPKVNLEVSEIAPSWGDIARSLLSSIKKINLKVSELASSLGKNVWKSLTKNIKHIEKKNENELYTPSEIIDNIQTQIIIDDIDSSIEEKDLPITFQVFESDGEVDKASNDTPITRSEFFLLHPKNPLSEEDKKLLKCLLFRASISAKMPTNKDDVPSHNQVATCSSQYNVLYVAPRRGTSSPWSSKTQDILRNIFPSLKNWDTGGLIERGYKYIISGSDGKDIDELKGFICDQMTQEILSEEELKQYFINDREINLNAQAA